MLKNCLPSSEDKILSPKYVCDSSRGMAVFEMIPLLVIFVLLLSFSYGFFGVIHTNILSSIGARNYAFETFRNRQNLTYFKDTVNDEEQSKIHYEEQMFRFHVSTSESNNSGTSGGDWLYFATARPIDMFGMESLEEATESTHNIAVRQLESGKRNSKVGVDWVWSKVKYGICLNSRCEK